MSGDAIDVAANLAAVRQRIDAAVPRESSRDLKVTLVAVSKGHLSSRIRPALAAGQRVFGENRVQEAEGKWPALKAEYPDTELHLIGPLQTNKVGAAVALFDVIQSVDRLKLARAITDTLARTGLKRRVFIQVNTGEEPQKSGVLPTEADAFISACVADLALPVAGLMCIPPINEEGALHFALLAQIAQRHKLPCLSMGMSADFESAIRFGATHVRIGTAVFGPRAPANSIAAKR